MKRVQRVLSVIIAFTMIIGMLPAQVFAETSQGIDYSDLTPNQYMAKVILNHNYSGTLNNYGKESQTPHQSLYEALYYNPEKASSARIIYNEFKDANDIKTLQGLYELLTFNPSSLADDVMELEDYYTAILLSIVDAKISDDNFIDDLNCKANKNFLTLSKNISNILKATSNAEYIDLSAISFNNLSLEESTQIADICINDAYSKDLWNKVGKDIGIISNILCVADNLNDAIKNINNYASLATINAATESVLLEIYNNCPDDNLPMKNAAKKVYEYVSEKMTGEILAMIELGEATFDVGYKILVSKFWSSCLTAVLGELAIGVLIGQAIGGLISNYCFATDAVNEQLVVIGCMVEFEDVMISAVNTLANKYKSNESEENADSYIRSLQLLLSTYDLGCDYLKDFIELVYTGGVISNIKYGNSDDLAFWRTAIPQRQGQIRWETVDFSSYSPYYKVDAPSAYEQYFGSEHNEEINITGMTVTQKQELNVGDEGATYNFFSVAYLPANHTEVMLGETVSSSDDSVIRVDNNNEYIGGYLTVVGEGSCILTFTTYDKKHSAYVEVAIGDPITPGDGSIDYLTYIIENDKVNITGYTESLPGNVVIPDTIEGYPVTTIGNSAFKDCTKLSKITFGKNVLIVEVSAFKNCANLTELDLGSNLTTINEDALYGCTSLTSITLPRSVTTVTDPFSKCTSLTEITLPVSMVYKDSYVWDNPSNIRTINLIMGNDKTGSFGDVVGTRTSDDIDGLWYKSTEAIETVTVEEGIIRIPDWCFSGCSKLTTIKLPESIQSIGSHAFSNCSSLETLNFPEGLTEIGGVAFSGCESLTAIKIPNSVSCLKIWTFARCTSLQEISIPVTCYIEDKDCFEETYPKKIVYTRGTTGVFPNPQTEGINSSMYTTAVPWDYSTDSVTEVVFENGVKNIPDFLFYNCTTLSNVTLPDTLTEIGDYSFLGCTALKNISLPDDLNAIGVGCFSKSGLEKIILPQNLSDIGYGTFYNCRALTSAIFYTSSSELMPANRNISEDVGYMQEYGDNKFTDSDFGYFEGCSSLTSVVLPNSLSIIGNQAFMNCSSLESITFPDTLTRINRYAFAGCCKLKNFYVPETVQQIESQAFGYDEYFNKIDDFIVYGQQDSAAHKYANANAFAFVADIPNTITDRGWCNSSVIWQWHQSSQTLLIEGTGELSFIGQDSSPYEYPWGKYQGSIKQIIIGEGITGLSVTAFYQHTSMESIIINAQIRSIPDYAFSECVNLKSITFPETVTSIGAGAFSGCSNLTDLVVPDTVTKIGKGAFENCKNLSSIELTGVTSISSSAFKNCEKLEKIVFSSDLLNIGDSYVYGGVFENCASLESVSLPASLQIIEGYAFKGCTSLASVTIAGNSQLKYVGEYAFSGTPWSKNEANYTNGFLLLNDCLIKVSSNMSGICQLPAGLTYIPEGVFNSCEGITIVVVPEGVTEIEYQAFYGARELAALYLPTTLKEIDYWNFDSTYDLFHVLYAGTEEDWSSISVGSSGNSCLINATKHYGVSDEVITHSVTQEPSCVEQGTAMLTCSLCDNKKEVAVSAKGHKGIFVSSVLPTCTTSGYDVYLCSDCGQNYQTNQINSLGHTGTIIKTVEPTCTQNGYSLYRCTTCNEEYSDDRKNALGHSSEAIEVVEPSCGTAGYTKYRCSICGYEHLSDYTDALVHVFENGTCSNCGMLEEDCIESKHNYANSCDETWTIQKDGAKRIAITFSGDTYTEKNCDFIYIYDGNDNLIGKHDGNSLASQRIVVHSSMVKIRLTSDSSSTYYGFSLTKVETYYDDCLHTNTTVINKSAASCTDNGNTGDTYCIDCQVVTVPGESIPALGHKYESGYCTVCGKVEGLLYSKDYNDNIVITGYEGNPTELTIPSVIEGCNVTKIGESAFKDCTSLQKITLPDTITTIEESAFENCKNLTGVTLSGVTHIYSAAFKNCENLVEVQFSNNLLYIGGGNMYGGAFENCTSLKQVNLPDGIKTIDSYVFSGCTALEKVTGIDNLERVGRYAFAETAFLKDSNNYENNVLYIGKHVVAVQSGFTGNLEIKDGTKTIVENAIVRSLVSVTIPESITTIDGSAFSYCSVGHVFYAGTEEQWSAIKIGSYGNSGLTNATRHYESGNCFEIKETIEPTCTTSGYTVYSCSICNAEHTGNYVYSDHNNIEIGRKAATCSSNGYIKMVCRICGDYGYYYYIEEGYGYDRPDHNMVLLKVIEPSCTNSGYTLYCCADCGEVYKDNWTDSLGGEHNHIVVETVAPICSTYGYTIYRCSNCNQTYNEYDYETEPENHTFTNGICDVCGVNSNFKYSISNGEVTITDYLGAEAEIVIPSTIEGYPVVHIGDSAFSYLDSLVSITIPNTVKTIGEDAFNNCNKLVTVNLPEGLQVICGDAFYSCDALSQITIPSTVTKIGNAAFAACSKLTDILVVANSTAFSSVDGVLFNNSQTELICYPIGKGVTSYTIPSSVERIGNTAFYNLKLREITVPDGVKEIGDEAFYSCQLSKVIIPNSVVKIGEDAFAYSTSIKELVLGNGLKRIENGAFRGCYYIPEIILPEGLLYIGDNAFNNCNSTSYPKTPSTINIPQSVEHIGYAAFSDSDNLLSISVDINNQHYCSIDGVLYNKEKTVLMCYPNGKEDAVIIIPNGVQILGEEAFSESPYLRIMIIPDSLVAICDGGGHSSSSIPVHILYAGTEEQWSKVYIDLNNQWFTEGTCHYSSSLEQISSSIVNPTCTEQGYTKYTCALCNEEIQAEYTDALGHEGEVVEIIAPTCTESGYTKYRCTVCDATYNGDWVYSTGHNKGSIIEVIKPTCEDWGYTIYQCGVCEETFEDDWTEDLGGVHTGNEIEVVLPTCTDYGYTKYHCTVCDSDYKDAWTEPLGHNAAVVSVVDPSCVELGYTEYECSVCTELYKDDIVSPVGHTFANDVCTNCGKHKDECIESSHNYENSCDETWVISKPNADRISVTFSSATEMEDGWDYIYIYDMDDNLIGKYSGTELASKKITVNGNAVKIRLTSDSSVSRYGFAISNVVSSVVLEDDNIEISIPESSFDSETVLCVDGVADDGIIASIPSGFNRDAADVFDIYFEKDNQRVQPSDDVTVYIPVPLSKDGSKCKVFHIDDTETATDMNAVYEDGYMVFETSHFSYYVLVEEMDCVIGDVNGDGAVDTLDRTMLSRYLANWEGYTLDQINADGADLNCDGSIDTLDRSILSRYLANWDGYETLPYAG